MPTFTQTAGGYNNLWRKATIAPSRQAAADKVARRIIGNRERYQAVAAKIGKPMIWPLLGALHDREASGSFAGHLHNGDSLKGYTRHVPAGRPKVGHGPPFTWEESAVDAVSMVPHAFQKVADWPIGRWLYEAEKYNGWGYWGRTRSPYVWAGTDLQQRGKYVADGHYSPSAWDTQLGVAAVLKATFKLQPELEPRPIKPPATPVVATAAGGGGAVAGIGLVGSLDHIFLTGAAIAACVIIAPFVWQSVAARGLGAMNDAKSWFQSSGVWGGIIAAVSGVGPIAAKALGYDISADDVQQVIAAASTIGSAIGGLVAIYGRVTATKVITK